jgi:FkbM family methyltransferase
MEQIFFDNEYDPKSPEHMRALRNYAAGLREHNRRSIIVDCGANVGFSAIWFAVQFPQAVTVAIEPEPENFKLLKLNVAAYPNIVPMQAGISDRRGTITLHNPNKQGEQWAWATRETPNGSIPTVTVPDVLSAYEDGEPLIVKIDIEGAEVELLRSNLEWVPRTALVIVETHDWLRTWGGTGHAVFSVLCQSPRDYLQRVENTFAFSHQLLAPREAAVP